jgi:adenylyltransferase/sulfurtransferase
VLGVLPGIIGTMQAAEAVKLILGIGEPLVGRLLLFDALTMKTRELRLRRNPECAICGDHASITELIDYELFCGIEPPPAAGKEDDESAISVAALKAKQDRGESVFLLDVREPGEYEIVNLGGHLIPLNDLPRRVHELDSSRDTVVYCHSGIRSGKAVQFLKQLGFRKVKNLLGGIDAWAEVIDPGMPRY